MHLSQKTKTLARILSLAFWFAGSLACSDTTQPLTTHESYLKIQQAVTGTFTIDQLNISIVRCGSANAYASPTNVFICQEYASQLRSELANNSATYSGVMLYTIMHEIGHILLHSWSHPEQKNEEFIDEFAMVLMVMFNQSGTMVSVSEYFDIKSETQHDSIIYRADNHHPAYGRRAENIRRWLSDNDLAHNWQPIIVPHIRSTVLEDLIRRPREWSDSGISIRELNIRQAHLL